MRPSCAVGIFCKEPSPGQVKTRLHGPLTPLQSAQLYGAFLADTIACMRGAASIHPSLWHPDTLAAEAQLTCIASQAGMALQRQCEGDLGSKIIHAARQLSTAEHPHVLIIGSDAPTLPNTYLSQAAQALHEGAQAVLGPTADGGYYLIGFTRPAQLVLRDIRWSSASACMDTQRVLLRQGVDVQLLPPWYDIDTIADLELLHLHLQMEPGAAPATRRVLRTMFPLGSAASGHDKKQS